MVTLVSASTSLIVFVRQTSDLALPLNRKAHGRTVRWSDLIYIFVSLRYIGTWSVCGVRLEAVVEYWRSDLQEIFIQIQNEIQQGNLKSEDDFNYGCWQALENRHSFRTDGQNTMASNVKLGSNTVNLQLSKNTEIFRNYKNILKEFHAVMLDFHIRL